MVILGALIGTEDLGQIIFGALSRTKDGAGVALTLGIFVSLIAICVDVIVYCIIWILGQSFNYNVYGIICSNNGFT